MLPPVIIHNIPDVDKECQIASPRKLSMSLGNITPEPVADAFSNYDVLLVRRSDDSVDFAPGGHVGNQRFRAILSLYRHRYLRADECGHKDECDKIAREILDAVYHKVVPNGRFYEQDRNNQWRELPSGSSTTAMIQMALKSEPTEYQERNPKRRKFSTDASVVSVDSDDDTIFTPKPFDVICDSTGLHLMKGNMHTGSNRFKIMLAIRKKSYSASGPSGKQKIAREIVDSIVSDASSHFLRVCNSSGLFRPMSRECAAACVRNCLGGEKKAEKLSNQESEVSKLKRRRKKKVVLGSIEHQKKRCCEVPANSSPPTTFKAVGVSVSLCK